MRRPLLLASLIVFLVAGKLDKMSGEERAHWRALRVFVETKDQKRWLRLKTKEQRDAWLQERDLWDRFYEHNEEVRQQIVAGDVRLGWNRHMLYMAWGAPSERFKLTGRPASRSERLIYRFEVDKEGYASPLTGTNPDYKAVDRYQINVILDDDVVADLMRLEDWD